MSNFKAFTASLLFFLIFLPDLVLSEKSKSQNPSVKCGVVTALSGHLSASGIAIKNAIVLAREQRSESNIDFIYEDDQFLPTKTVSAVKKLIEVDKISCLVVFGSPTSMAVADIAEKSKVPMISIAISNKVVKERPYVFLAHVTSKEQNNVIIQNLKKRAYPSTAIVTTISDGTLELRDFFLQSKPNKILTDIEVNPTDTDLRSTATKIIRTNPSSVFINLLPPQTAIMSKQLRALGYKGDLFSGAPIGNTAEVIASNGALDGTWFVSLDSRNAGKYYQDYEKRFNEPSAMQGLYGYDVANIFMDAAETKDIFGYLSTLKIINGNLGRYTIDDNIINMPAGLWLIKANGFDYCINGC